MRIPAARLFAVLVTALLLGLCSAGAASGSLWTRQLGTASMDYAWGVAVDGSGNVYAAGNTNGGLDGNTNAGYSDIFLVKYNSSGVKQWTRQMGTAYIYVSLDYPYLRASSEANRLCSDCHTEATHKDNNCLTCHQSHNTDNLAGIRGKVRTTDRSEHVVKFLDYTKANSFADGDTTYDGICEVCHTSTKYYRRDGSGFVNHSSGVNQSGKDCTTCHSHATGFAR